MSSPSPHSTIAPTSATARRQAALDIAEECRQMLQQKFGATDVIIFGSLRGDTPWHQASDLDLAVRGLAPEVVHQAYEQLETIVPEWLPFDLVVLEQAESPIRERILQHTPMPKNTYLATKLRLDDEMALIERTVDRLNQALAQADTVDDLFLTPTLAAYVEDFYTGCERLAERVAVMLDGNLPSGEHWHQQLLQQVSAPSEQGRPALWKDDLVNTLERYRRFRHRARHLYSNELDGQRVLAMAQQVTTVFAQVQQAIAHFSLWLTQQAS